VLKAERVEDILPRLREAASRVAKEDTEIAPEIANKL
jgi:hypothetical protein